MRNFTTEDFNGAGQYLIRMGPEEIDTQNTGKGEHTYRDAGYLSTIMFKVGYVVNNLEIGNGNQIACLIAMSDGMVSMYNYTSKHPEENDYEKTLWQGNRENNEPYDSKQKLVDWLNNQELSDEYRFATQEEVVRVVLYQRSKWK